MTAQYQFRQSKINFKKLLLSIILLLIIFSSSLLYADNPDDQREKDKKSFTDFASQYLSGITNGAKEFVYGNSNTAANGIYSTFAPSSCEPNTDLGAVKDFWIGPSIFVIMLVFFGLAILYMIGNFMSMPYLVAMAKDEAFENIRSVIRIAFLIFILGSSQLWFLGTTSNDDLMQKGDGSGGQVKTMIDGAMAFSRLMVSDMTTEYSVIVLYNTVFNALYSLTLFFGTNWRTSYQFNLGPVLRPIIDLLGTTMQFLSVSISEWFLHIFTLCLIKKYTWTLFIPMGIFLRAIPHTRSAGEALITISCALAIVYPFMFIFDYEVHKIMSANLADSKTAMQSFINNSGIFSVFGSALVIVLIASGVFIPLIMGGALNLALEIVRNSVYYIVIIGLLLPFLNIFVTLTIARELGRLFSVDVDFMSFMRII